MPVCPGAAWRLAASSASSASSRFRDQARIALAERVRLGAHDRAWPSTVHALKAIGLSILIELAAGLLMAGAWLAALIT